MENQCEHVSKPTSKAGMQSRRPLWSCCHSQQFLQTTCNGSINSSTEYITMKYSPEQSTPSTDDTRETAFQKRNIPRQRNEDKEWKA